MAIPDLQPGSAMFHANEIVELVECVAGVQSLDGDLVARDSLGPGLTRATAEDGKVHVYWTGAACDSWVDPGDLTSLGPEAHLLTVVHRDAHGNTGSVRRNIITETQGFTWNWTVELLPDNIIRALRPDGWKWTFTWHSLQRRAHPAGGVLDDTNPLMEEDWCEALAVAEYAMLAASRRFHLQLPRLSLTFLKARSSA